MSFLSMFQQDGGLPTGGFKPGLRGSLWHLRDHPAAPTPFLQEKSSFDLCLLFKKSYPNFRLLDNIQARNACSANAQ